MTCRFLFILEVPRRPGNALNVEVGTPTPRCTLKTPEHWTGKHTWQRWWRSGGSALVLGACRPGSEVECSEEKAR